MEPFIDEMLADLELGEPITHKNMTVIPVKVRKAGTVAYRTLSDALGTGELVIGEVAESGSVPELRVANKGRSRVLLLDSQELAGAKQNRTLNTSILVAAGAETVIPVSCTEQGRWAYRSRTFDDTQTLTPSRMRSRKNASVTMNLRASGGHGSDQRAVWEEVDALHEATSTRRSTSSLQDVYSTLNEDLKAFSEAFKPVSGQQGLLVIIDGKPEGLDVISDADAYAQLHDPLVRSYAFEAVVAQRRAENASRDPVDTGQLAQAFIATVREAKEEQHEAVGEGVEYRYEGESLTGAVLAFEREVVHANFATIGEQRRAARRRSMRFDTSNVQQRRQ